MCATNAQSNQSRITLKRHYTENYPAKTVGKHAAIRNKIIEALKDGQLTKEEFDSMVSSMTEDSKRWMRRNSVFFNIQEDKIGLSKAGQKIASTIFQSNDNALNLKQTKITIPIWKTNLFTNLFQISLIQKIK